MGSLGLSQGERENGSGEEQGQLANNDEEQPDHEANMKKLNEKAAMEGSATSADRVSYKDVHEVQTDKDVQEVRTATGQKILLSSSQIVDAANPPIRGKS